MTDDLSARRRIVHGAVTTSFVQALADAGLPDGSEAHMNVPFAVVSTICVILDRMGLSAAGVKLIAEQISRILPGAPYWIEVKQGAAPPEIACDPGSPKASELDQAVRMIRAVHNEVFELAMAGNTTLDAVPDTEFSNPDNAIIQQACADSARIARAVLNVMIDDAFASPFVSPS